MAMHRQHPRNVDDATLDSLRALVRMSREHARTLVKREGLDGLRIRVAATLYAAEYLTSGEAADRDGIAGCYGNSSMTTTSPRYMTPPGLGAHSR